MYDNKLVLILFAVLVVIIVGSYIAYRMNNG